MPAFIFQINYTYQFPFADMKQRFGSNSSLGGSIAYKTKHNYIVGLEGMAIIGEEIKDNDPLKGIYGKDGSITGADGTSQSYQLHERGFYIKFMFSKIIHFKKPNVNSGLLLQVGGGWMQHKIKISVDQNQVPQLNGDYQQGYDRLSGGVVISQFIGYQYMGVRRKINLYGGIEFSEGFLKGMRTWNYATNQADDASRFDVLIGVKVGWILPKYFTATEKYYYN